MTDATIYRKQVLKAMLDAIQTSPDVLAAWEGGSAATGTLDQYSDIDLCVLAKMSSTTTQQSLLDLIETSLKPFEVTHAWQAAKSFWGEGLKQRVLVLKDSPKHFFIDVGIFDQAHAQLVTDFLEVERHGQPIIYFDKQNLVKLGHTDANALFKRQQTRVDEIAQAFPIFKTLVLKELDRGQAIDAISFYQNALLRPLVEVLGMIYRPFKFDFGMRYLHKHFPQDAQKLIHELSYISDAKALRSCVDKAETAFYEAVKKVKAKTSLL